MKPWRLGSRTLNRGFPLVDAAEFPHTLQSQWGSGMRGGGSRARPPVKRAALGMLYCRHCGPIRAAPSKFIGCGPPLEEPGANIQIQAEQIIFHLL